MGMDSQGFTLIELLIAVAITAVLAGIAYPGYTGHLKKVYRAEIVALLTEQAHYLERFYARNGTFIDASSVSGGNDRYRITAALNPQDFQLLATPVVDSVMAGDPCGDFGLTGTGARTNPGAAPEMSRKLCWGQ
ncbi:prepilin-type N-terminal cleavage/methylation domain-containing protein [Pseudomonas sp. MAFF 311095]|uniref:Prepilin-type N-terminal cleavage/methylation domain-containing protein n=1 Tax=Pseudomonas petroselini TaxID=2899822 RepID=A0ABS8QZZ8_9PSED|nr:type IV pilin protein [Pseudomonas petroselini]MCD7041290.1 prepilin-type N-terminal cleavage/methylation domain-containing protein [Pseudomonas petroselini]MCD7045686.1 prepilin-type N-terminal cleavage/methylation domain-containing protein [Pseudomonas petroselini]MCD7068213.1 prepilin-type N-terminal cleavage/methylation domain-containing protein [Pseudomonas petroselini]MCD7082288.1 prepilin-type N-terminal cleavage/methylation domain-containing protein [Pseudomonas petroselini]